MLQVEIAFNLLLRDDTAVTALVGARIYNSHAPQTYAGPYIVHRDASRETPDALDGSLGLRKTRIRVYSAAKQYDQARAIDEAVRMAVEGFSGVVSNTDSPPDTLRIQYIKPVFSHDGGDPETKTEEIITDYEVTAHEEIPVFS